MTGQEEDAAPGDGNLTGLAISGGGIRSAAFALGVLQSLAKHDRLKYFDYMSTVSGGGYIASSVSYWLHERSDLGLGPDDFPYGAHDPSAWRGLSSGDRQLERLAFLRKCANYLMPGYGITFTSGLSVVARATLLNLVVWLPIITLFLAILITVLPGGQFCGQGGALACYVSPTMSDAFAVILVDSVALAIGLAGVAFAYNLILMRPGLDWLAGYLAKPPLLIWVSGVGLVTIVLVLSKPDPPPVDLMWFLIAAAVLVGTFAVLCIFYSLATGGRERPTHAVWFGLAVGWIIYSVLGSPPADLILAGALLLSIAFFGVIIYENALVEQHQTSDGGRHPLLMLREFWRHSAYPMRRLFEVWSGRYMFLLAVALVIGLIPIVSEWVVTAPDAANQTGDTSPTAATGAAGGAVALSLGLITALVAFFQSGTRVSRFLKERGFDIAGGVTATVAAGFILFGIVVMAHFAAQFVVSHELQHPSGAAGLWAVAAHIIGGSAGPWSILAYAVALSVAVGLMVNTNHTALARFYRDRLLEAFMPDSLDCEKPDVLSRRPALAGDRMLLTQASDRSPFHIINTTCVLVHARDSRIKQRGGANFSLTRAYCGSNPTGWRGTAQFMEGEMGVATAMAASGAAANPNTGFGGVGPTRSRAVSSLMALLNIRLGYWVPHPCDDKQGRVPHHFRPGISAVFPFGHYEGAAFQEISDGGHFENLGIYELIRRRCKLIVVIDGGQDARGTLESLQLAVRRIGEDFGAEVRFEICPSDKTMPERQEAERITSDLVPALAEAPQAFTPEDEEQRRDDLSDFPLDGMVKQRDGIYPPGVKFVDRGFAVAEILYACDFDANGAPKEESERSGARLIYIKAALFEGLPLPILGYRAANPEFPNQPTTDQFFDEDQFEAYRELGYFIAERTVGTITCALKARVDAPV